MLKLSLDKIPVEEVLTAILRVLERGGIVAYPTESFYALGVMADNEAALKRLYELKKRSLEKAMPVIVGNNDILKTVVKSIPSQAEKLMEKFWPGALTIVFEARDNLPELLTGSQNTVAARIPGKSFALSLARVAHFPITATSANRSGKVPAREPGQLIDYFGGKIDLIVDGGKTPGGKPSTIIDVTVTPPRVLRKGSISFD